MEVTWCAQCDRYLKGTQWWKAELESRELLAICLKRVKGLGKVAESGRFKAVTRGCSLEEEGLLGKCR